MRVHSASQASRGDDEDAATARPQAQGLSVSRKFLSLTQRRTSVRGSASAIAAAGSVGLGRRGSRTPAFGGRKGRARRRRFFTHCIAVARALPTSFIVRPTSVVVTVGQQGFAFSGHVPIRFEAAEPGGPEYPHSYGALPVGAVTGMSTVSRDAAGRLVLPS